MQKSILQAELDTVEENLEVLKYQGRDVSRGMLKGLEKRKQNLEVKLQTIIFSIKERTDDIVDFKMMGIDHIFVDESHYPNKNKIRTIIYNILYNWIIDMYLFIFYLGILAINIIISTKSILHGTLYLHQNSQKYIIAK